MAPRGAETFRTALRPSQGRFEELFYIDRVLNHGDQSMSGKSNTGVTVLLVLAGLGAGCYAPQEVTLHEAGVYKGSKDPLLSQHRQSEAKETLQQRFDLVQTDR